MGALRPVLGGLALSALLVGSAVAQETLRLTRPEARAYGYQLLQQNRPQAAAAIAEGLLRADATDIAALILLSRAQTLRGLAERGRDTGQMAWDTAGSDAEKYGAAVAVAQAHYALGQSTRAQLWLRRAAEHAPSDEARNRTERDFRQVRARNPWATNLSFNITPSSNVNNGTSAETLTLYWNGIPFTSAVPDSDQALSGLAISAAVNTRYRMSQSDRHAFDTLVSLSHREVVLSDGAKDQAPEADNADFRQTSLSFGQELTLRSATGSRDLTFEATGGRVWYGGERLYDFKRLGVSGRFFPSARTGFFANIDRTWETGGDDRADRDIWQTGIRGVTLLEGGAQLGLSLSHTESQSTATFLDYERSSVGVTWQPKAQIAQTSFEFGLNYAEKTHDVDFYSVDGRVETTTEASVTMVFNGLDYYGFVPSMTLSAARTDANIDFYDSESFNLGIGIRSSF